MPGKASCVYYTLHAAHICRWGTFPRPSVPQGAPDKGNAGGGSGGGGHGVWEPRQRVQICGGLEQGHRVPRAELAIAKEVGDRAGEGSAYANLGVAYQSQGAFSKAIEYHVQGLVIAKEVGDRAGEVRAYANLGTCHMHLNEFVKATTKHNMSWQYR